MFLAKDEFVPSMKIARNHVLPYQSLAFTSVLHEAMDDATRKQDIGWVRAKRFDGKLSCHSPPQTGLQK
jgi:hypothetical protein